MWTLLIIVLCIIALPFVGFGLLWLFVSFVDWLTRSVPARSHNDLLNQLSEDEEVARERYNQTREERRRRAMGPIDITPQRSHTIRPTTRRWHAR